MHVCALFYLTTAAALAVRGIVEQARDKASHPQPQRSAQSTQSCQWVVTLAAYPAVPRVFLWRVAMECVQPIKVVTMFLKWVVIPVVVWVGSGVWTALTSAVAAAVEVCWESVIPWCAWVIDIMLRLLASVAATFSWLVSIVAGTVSAIGDTLSPLIAYATNALRAVTGCIASNAVHLLEYVAGSLERMGTYLSSLARDAVVATWAHVASGTRWLCAAALHAVSTAWAVVRAPGMWLLNLLTTFIHELQKVLL